MAVGKIEYKKILDDTDVTPTRLKDLFVSQLKNNSEMMRHNINWAMDPSQRYSIMSPEEASRLIASRQASTPPSTDRSASVASESGSESGSEATNDNIDNSNYTSIQGGVWTGNEQQTGTASSQQPDVQTSTESTEQSVQISTQQPGTKIVFKTPEDFVQQMMPVYAAELKRRGYDPRFAEYLVAQDALESGWGKSQAGTNNFGGIKVDTKDRGKGLGTIRTSKEWNGKEMVDEQSEFRNFATLQEYVNYKIDFVNRKQYNVFAYRPEDFFAKVKAGGYATDPNYIKKMGDMLSSVRRRIK